MSAILTDRQRLHVAVMRSIAGSVSDTPMVLKGGTSLLLCYVLNRFSEDLDFDSHIAINLDARIRESLLALSRDVTIHEIKVVNDTETVRRVRLRYSTCFGEGRLKIETSFREDPDSSSVWFVHGIKVYRVAAIIEQKLNALIGRTTARDLHDVNFLVRAYSQEFTEAAKANLIDIIGDLDAIESRFRPAYEEDGLLSPRDLEITLLELIEALEIFKNP